MLNFVKGNLLDSGAEALVNTVNEVGVMGKGIALMFSEAFPKNTAAYADACNRGDVRVGRMFVTENEGLISPRWIINFPTKRHWRNPSKIEWVREGLADLARVIEERGIKSVAVPPLGCGNGGLNWNNVKPLIIEALSGLGDVDVQIFEPVSRYQNVPKTSGVVKLTPARALITELIRRYSVLGFECTILEVQKLAWFMRRALAAFGLDDPLRLNFAPHKYGPYADGLRHLLNALDGSFIHSDKRLADAGPFDLVDIDERLMPELRVYLDGAAARKYGSAVDWAASLIDGFESPFGMELLATIDWLLTEGYADPTVESIRAALATWPGGKEAASRKVAIFDERVVGIALERLTNLPPVELPQASLSHVH